MSSYIKLVLKQLHSHWPVVITILAYVVLTFRWPGTAPHFLYNLEPYPDGLFYVYPAMRLAEGQSFDMSYQGYVAVKPRVVPLYSVVLAIGYVINHQPAFFYWTNVSLGVLTIVCVYLILVKLRLPAQLQVLTLAIYLSSLSVVWLPTVPMAENLSLLMVMMAVLSVISLTRNQLSVGVSALLIGCLVLAKYTLVLPALVLVGYLLWRLVTTKNWLGLLTALCVWLIVAIGFIVYQIQIGYNPLAAFTPTQFNQPSPVSQTVFYSTKYVLPNLKTYARTLVGGNTNLLWLSVPLSTLVVTIIGGVGLIGGAFKLKQPEMMMVLAVWLAQFPLLLVFYVADSRYIIYSVPLLAIGWGMAMLKWVPAKWWWLVTVFCLISQIWFQKQLLKSIIAANWFNRTEAWQYQAIQHLNQTIPTSTSTYVITVLPPYLVELYRTHDYQVLPLSSAQEFLDKGQPVWGQNLPYDLLMEYFGQLLDQGKLVYVSAAYLTADHRLGLDFEKLKVQYQLTLVAEGCLQTCNVYQLSRR